MKATESNLIKSEACISECSKYRYWINHVWDSDKNIGAFVCLNPSKATSLKLDNTLSNCNNLSLQWGWGGFYIVNLFAYRSTDKGALRSVEDPIGSKNDVAIKFVANLVDDIVMAWGNGYKKRGVEVLRLLKNKRLYCLEKNKSGGYRHPGRIKLDDYPKPLPLRRKT